MNLFKTITGTLALASSLCFAADVVPGKTFELDFESADGKAKFAKGNPKPKYGYVTPDAPGLNGKAYRLTKNGKTLAYDIGNHVDNRKGTVNLWVNTENYKTKKLGGWSVHPVYLFTLNFEDANGKRAYAFCYIYRGSDAAGVRFLYDGRIQSFSFGSHATTAFPVEYLQQNKWHMVTCTWDKDRISIYFDGVYQASSLRSSKFNFIDSLKPVSGKPHSNIIIRNSPQEQSVVKRNENTDIDNFSIYDRVLSPAEIGYLYAQGQNKKQADTDLPVTMYQGTFRNGKEYVKCDFDITTLAKINPVFAGNNTLSYDVFSSNGKKLFSGSEKLGSITRKELLFYNLAQKDKYTVTYTLTGANGKKLSFKREFDKPDTSWGESTAGMEDTVPTPWTKPVLNKDDSVSVWNRTITFNGGPFPANIITGGKKMLFKAPQLVVTTDKGQFVPTGKITKRTQGGSFVKLNGIMTGKDGFTADFETMIDFDGFVQVDFKVRKAVAVKSMKVDYQVAKEFAEHFMLPKVHTDKDPVVNFTSPITKILYFASEKGGFCWGNSGDANWVYDKGAVLYSVNKDTKSVELRVIQKPVTIPADTPYQFCFTATPTKPLMKGSRAWRKWDESRTDGAVNLRYNMYQGAGNLLIDPARLKKSAKGKRNLQLYSASSFLEASNLEARWFFDEWLMYSYQYGMGSGIAIPSCLNCSKANFLAENTKKSLDIPEFELVDGYYFDCCGVYSCGNKLHGCGYVDKFGREVKTMTLLAHRSYLKRIIRLLHSKGRTLGAHGQFSFNPCSHSLCDYWLTGEELRGMAMKNGAEIYCDTDKVTDLHLRTNSNHRILSNVVMCLLYYGKSGKSYMPALTRLLLEDQKPIGFHSKDTAKRMDTMWQIFAKFKVDDGTVHRFFEQNDITADNPDIKITYYRCPDNKFVAVVGNTTKKDVKGKVDFNKLKKGNFVIGEAVSECEWVAKDGKISVYIPAMDFIVLTF